MEEYVPSILFQMLIDVHEVFDIRQSVFNTVYSVRCLKLSKGQGKLSRSCPNNISINSHKKHGGWNEKRLRRAKKRRSIGCPLDLFVLSGELILIGLLL
ncbi:hypothetical protein NQ317_005828 [Molorchus minor]|uniref:Uncharacterized protein n=1 Tax=Molorchus minor TaxID=1323400 RepID=A0ABQ9JXV9_9CUCU|nr:hypothetical protein NQ317_005828 [Molorchus minor]